MIKRLWWQENPRLFQIRMEQGMFITFYILYILSYLIQALNIFFITYQFCLSLRYVCSADAAVGEGHYTRAVISELIDFLHNIINSQFTQNLQTVLSGRDKMYPMIELFVWSSWSVCCLCCILVMTGSPFLLSSSLSALLLILPVRPSHKILLQPPVVTPSTRRRGGRIICNNINMPNGSSWY